MISEFNKIEKIFKNEYDGKQSPNVESFLLSVLHYLVEAEESKGFASFNASELRIYDLLNVDDVLDEVNLSDALEEMKEFVKMSKATKGGNIQRDLFDDGVQEANQKGYVNADYVEYLIEYCVEQSYFFAGLRNHSLIIAPHPTAKKKMQMSDISDLTKEISDLREKIRQDVFGQDVAVNSFLQGYYQAILQQTSPDNELPSGVYLFAGSPGVGKTYLASLFAKYSNLPYEIYNMSEYSDDQSNQQLIGFAPTWRNSQPGYLTEYVEKNPKCVLVFDEIEKAHKTVLNLFLQILGRGKLRDQYTQKDVSFKDTIIIFTTNVGKEIYENQEGDLSSVSPRVVLDAIGKEVDPKTGEPYFSSALVSRFASGNVILFNNMSADLLLRMVETELTRVKEEYANTRSLNIEWEENVPVSILYSLGANADARSVRARTKSFIHQQLMELFLFASAKGKDVGKIKSVKITASIGKNKDILELFRQDKKIRVLVNCSQRYVTWMNKWKKSNKYELIRLTSTDGDILDKLNQEEFDAVLVDTRYWADQDPSSIQQLNIADYRSYGAKSIRRIHQQFPNLPIYCLEWQKNPFTEEEKISLKNNGITGFVVGNSSFDEQFESIIHRLNLTNHLFSLARQNKEIHYYVAKPDYKNTEAEIRLYDYSLKQTIQAEDSKDFVMDVPEGKFSDVIGNQNAKEEMKEFVEFLSSPKAYLKKRNMTDKDAPKGILMYGSPGTGKTMLARVLAAEAKVPFISTQGNALVSPTLVHQIFAKARKYAPSIIFIDEFDSIAMNRQAQDSYRNDAVNALLTEMDGFSHDVSRPVIVIAATNMNADDDSARSNDTRAIDPAVRRRFDRAIEISLPGSQDVLEYFQKEKKANPGLYKLTDKEWNDFANRCVFRNFGEIGNILKMAKRIMIREGQKTITNDIMNEAFNQYVIGDMQGTYNPQQAYPTAIHEAGHAFMKWYYGMTFNYITVQPRGKAAGFVEGGSFPESQREFFENISVCLAGRAAEYVFINPQYRNEAFNSGASSDLRSATRLAHFMISQFGLIPEYGMAVYPIETLEGERAVKHYDMVNQILNQRFDEAKIILAANAPAVEKLAQEVTAHGSMPGANAIELIENVVSRQQARQNTLDLIAKLQSQQNNP